jgi:hypothetical protein
VVARGSPTAKGGEIFWFEVAVGKGIAGVGVEAGGDGDQGGTTGEHDLPSLFEKSEVGEPVGVGWDGGVETIGTSVLATGSGITRKLVDGKEIDGGMINHDVFGAVSVMDIEVEDGDSFDARLDRCQSGNGDRVEIAESHGLCRGGMMSGRAHQAQSGMALAGRSHGAKGSADGLSRVLADPRIAGRVGIEGTVGLLE